MENLTIYFLPFRSWQLGCPLRPIQERWLWLRQMALRPEDRKEHSKLPSYLGERQCLGSLRFNLSVTAHRSDCWTRNLARWWSRSRTLPEGYWSCLGRRLQGFERPPRLSRRNIVETKHVHSWYVIQGHQTNSRADRWSHRHRIASHSPSCRSR